MNGTLQSRIDALKEFAESMRGENKWEVLHMVKLLEDELLDSYITEYYTDRLNSGLANRAT